MADIPLGELDVPIRVYNCLRNAGHETVGDVLRVLERDDGLYELLRIPNFGRKSYNDFRFALTDYDLPLLPSGIEASKELAKLKAQPATPREPGTSVYLLKSELGQLATLELPAAIAAKIQKALPKVR